VKVKIFVNKIEEGNFFMKTLVYLQTTAAAETGTNVSAMVTNGSRTCTITRLSLVRKKNLI
jgi:hypothetical protein